MVGQNIIDFTAKDRVLVILNDSTINGTTRLQKYGFLLSKQYKKELTSISNSRQALAFYEDWEPLWYGPFSKNLQRDVKECVRDGLINKEIIDADRNSYQYTPTLSGRVRWRKLTAEFQNEMIAIHKKITNLQNMRQELLIEGIYNAYPKYIKHSTIKNMFREAV